MKRKIKGVIFDLDGTLIDSMNVWTKIDRDFLKENGISDPPPDISDRVRKMTIDESSQYFIDEFVLPVTKEYVISRIEELVRIEYAENIRLKQGAEELLDYLDSVGIPYGVATATYQKLAESVLRRCGIFERFRFVFTDIEYPRGKNFPDIFIGGAEQFSAVPSEVLVVEDSLHCIETAASAGFVTAGVYDDISAYEKEKIKAAADYYVDSLIEIKNIL